MIEYRYYAMLRSLTALNVLVLAGCGAVDGDPSSASTSVSASSEGQSELARGTFETPYGPIEMPYQEVNGEALVAGDMLMPLPGPHYRSAGVTGYNLLWSNGIIRVESQGLATDPRVVDAIRHWEATTRMRFVMGATSGPRLVFLRTSEETCISHIGMQIAPPGATLDGRQATYLGDVCTTGNILHELGHTVGLFHEQQRSDRDSYITVNTACVVDEYLGEFGKLGTDAINIGEYDYDSIMHYSSTGEVLKPGCTAVMTRNDNGQPISGQRDALTAHDINGARYLYLPWQLQQRAVDYDGDGIADLGTFTPTTGLWSVLQSTGGSWTFGWGMPGDVPVPGYYNSTTRADVAVWRPSTGQWFVWDGSEGTYTVTQWGEPQDVPVPADYDGDGYTDYAVWRPSTGDWWFVYSSGGSDAWTWGEPTDIPLAADFDNDGYADPAIWRPSTGEWWVSGTTWGVWSVAWGAPEDLPVPADYDGDGNLELAVWRPSTGEWYILNLYTWAQWSFPWGEKGDVPLPGHYANNGTSQADVAIWRPSTGVYWIGEASIGGGYHTTQWGALGDVPVP